MKLAAALNQRVAWVITGVMLVAVGGCLATAGSELGVAVVLAAAFAIAILVKIDSWQRLLVIALFLLFGASSSIEPLAAASFYTRFVAVAVLAMWTWRARDRKLRDCIRPVRVLVVGLWLAAGFAAASTLWSVDIFTTGLQSVILGLLALLVHGLVIGRWATRSNIPNDLGVLVVLFATIFAAGIIIDLLSPYVSLGEILSTRNDYYGRYFGLFANPNTLGNLAALVLPLAIGVWRANSTRLHLFAAAITATAVAYSLSRTSLIALVIALAWVALRARAKSVKVLIPVLWASALLSTVAVSLRLQLPLTITEFAARFTNNEGDLLNTRNVAWVEAIEAWKQRPVEGYGYAAGPRLFQNLRQSGQATFPSDVVHNSYLQWFLELGLLGLVPLVVLLVALIWVVFRARLDGTGVWLVASVVAGISIQFTESSMFGIGSPYAYVFWLSVAAALVNSEVGQVPAPTATRTRAAPRRRNLAAHR